MKYNISSGAIELSVRSLCEYAFSPGDLGRRVSTNADGTNKGEIVARLQAEAGVYYRPDVELCHTEPYKDMYYTVSGRADGLLRASDGFVLDRLVMVRQNRFYDAPSDALLAELKCYAFFFAVNENLDKIGARLTYYRIGDGKIRYISYSFSTEELRGEYRALLEKIHSRATLCRKHVSEELPAAASVRFPYRELREGQEWMIRECFSSIKNGRRLFVEAPTGTGKTISALYPAVRAQGQGRIDKIFYLTAKASTRSEAFRAAGDLYAAGARLRTVVVTAKEQCCLCPARLIPENQGKNLCNPRDCEYAREYYGRIQQALSALLEGGYGYPRKRIEQVAKQYRVCPYELSLDLSELCDIVICDYNYAFDPSVYFRRYFSDEAERGRYAFLIDEAHNLPDRARAMYSAEITRMQIDRLLSEMSETDSEIVSALDSLRRAFDPLYALCRENLSRDSEGREMGFYAAKSLPANFAKAIELFVTLADKWQKKNREHPLFDGISALCRDAKRYMLVSDYFDKGFLSYIRVMDGDVSASICCVDPASVMDTLLRRAHATVFFSATLTPFDYYASLLGGAKDVRTLAVPSPFEAENLCVAVADYVSTRMETRKQSVSRFATLIAATVSARPGNYIAYFPSYACMEEVFSAFCKKYPKVEVVLQKRGMGIREKEEFLFAFREDTGHLRVGFCVLGGAFAEGVDLPGNRLIGAIVFGVGLPALSDERNMIRDYADPDGAEGYDYAYTYPGMNHVLQAAGRVIRRDDDRGVVILADDRYALPKYRALLPPHWKDVQYAGNARSLAEIVRRFWDNA